MVVRLCDPNLPLQKFKVGNKGLLTFADKPTKCVSKNQSRLVISTCSTAATPPNAFLFSYNLFTDRIHYVPQGTLVFSNANKVPGVDAPIKLQTLDYLNPTQYWEIV